MKIKNSVCSIFHWKDSIKGRWIISCLGLSFLPLLISIILFFNSSYSFKNQTIQNNEAMLVQISSLMDQDFYDIKTIVQKLSEDPSIRAFSLPQGSDSAVFLKRKLEQELLQYCSYSSYIKDIFIYFQEHDQIITSYTAASPYILYNAYYKNSGLLYEEWLSIFHIDGTEATRLLPESPDFCDLVYLRSLSSLSPLGPDVTIAVIIKRDHVMGMAESVGKHAFCEWNILLSDNSVFLPLSDNLQPYQSQLEEIPSSRILRRQSFPDGNVISTQASQFLDVVYLLNTPRSAYLHGQRVTNLFFLFGLLLLLGGSIWLTRRFIYKNYAPIREIVDIVRCPELTEQTSSENEYALIKNAITHFQSTNVQMMQKLDRKDDLLRENILTLLLHNFPSAKQEAEKSMEALGLDFAGEYFSVLLVSLDPVGGDVSSPRFAADQRNFLSMYLANWKDITFWEIELSGRLVVLFNLEEAEAAGWKVLCGHLIGELEDAWNTVFAENLLLTASECHEDLEGIAAAYEEAQYSMDYKLVFGTDYTSENAGAVQLVRVDQSYYYPPEEENRLFNVIAGGNLQEAEEAFSAIWQKNIQNNGINSGLLYCLLFDIAGTAIRACRLITPVSGSSSLDYSQMISTMMSRKNTEEMRKCLLLFISSVCAAYSTEHSKSSDKLKNEILSYIDSHYNDPSVCVESIGKVFHKSRAYLFSLFKEDTGFSLLYHINKVRIYHAKELLLTTEKSVQDIAEETGFGSSGSFTRTFKKFENLTPSRFRETRHS